MLDLKEQNIEALARGSLYSNVTEKLKDFLFSDEVNYDYYYY